MISENTINSVLHSPHSPSYKLFLLGLLKESNYQHESDSVILLEDLYKITSRQRRTIYLYFLRALSENIVIYKIFITNNKGQKGFRYQLNEVKMWQLNSYKKVKVKHEEVSVTFLDVLRKPANFFYFAHPPSVHQCKNTHFLLKARSICAPPICTSVQKYALFTQNEIYLRIYYCANIGKLSPNSVDNYVTPIKDIYIYIQKRKKSTKKRKKLNAQNWQEAAAQFLEDAQNKKSVLTNPSKRSAQEQNEDRFEQFWKRYPVKRDKKRSRRTFLNLRLTKNQFDEIMLGLERYLEAAQQAKKRRVFFPEFKYPNTWLNGECWNDDLNLPPNPQPRQPSFSSGSASDKIWEILTHQREGKDHEEDA